MKRIFDKETVNSKIKESPFAGLLTSINADIFLIEYKKGELVSSPFTNRELFQIVVSGELSIYTVRNDGSRYFVAGGTSGYIIGELDLFNSDNPTDYLYVEVSKKLTCIAFSTKDIKDELLNNVDFLRLSATTLAYKMVALSKMDATPTTLSERVLTYMHFKCEDGLLKGIEKCAFQMHCSARQLQRVLNELEAKGSVEKIGKGAYILK